MAIENTEMGYVAALVSSLLGGGVVGTAVTAFFNRHRSAAEAAKIEAEAAKTLAEARHLTAGDHNPPIPVPTPLSDMLVVVQGLQRQIEAQYVREATLLSRLDAMEAELEKLRAARREDSETIHALRREVSSIEIATSTGRFLDSADISGA